MLRRLAFLLFFGLLLLSLPKSWAYQSGQVNQPSLLTIANQSQGALGIASTHPQYSTVSGVAAINFAQGATTFGLRLPVTTSTPNQPGHHLETRNAFRVTNNTSTCRVVRVAVPGGGVPNLTTIYGRPTANPPGSGTQLASGGGTAASSYNLGAGAVMVVDFIWDGSVTSAGGTFRLEVSSTSTC